MNEMMAMNATTAINSLLDQNNDHQEETVILTF